MEPRELDTIEDVFGALCLGLRDYMHKCNFNKALVGLSGGVDSAVTCALAAAALGKENVTGVTMPSRFSSQGSVDDSRALAENLDIRFKTIPIEPMYEAYLASLKQHFEGRPADIAEENLQARIRGTILMALSNKFGCLLLSTGNKSEIAVGYCTLYGDMSGGLSVISDLPKTMVYRLAEYINREKEIIPLATMTKPPSAELRPNQTDQDTLPPYEILDPILELLVEKGKSIAQIAAEGFDEKTVSWVAGAVRKAEYKRRQAAPGLKVTPKAFGIGRRFPLAANYKR
jgi:NAD+ synthase (glutamine-hydrolysing)